MAVGARPRDILRQFLVEAVVLSAIGGAIGLALGTGASVGATLLINSLSSGAPWPIVVSFPAAIIAMAFAAAVGLVFGYYPARRKPARPDRSAAVRVMRVACRVGGVFGTHLAAAKVGSEDSTHPTQAAGYPAGSKTRLRAWQ